MVGTHDSVTGEKGVGLISWFVTPFARTQNKTLKEQYEAGARFFDIRVKKYKGLWHGAHGLWTSKATIWEILRIFTDELSQDEPIYFCLTLEGTDKYLKEFEQLCNEVLNKLPKYTNVHLVSTAVKLPKWKDLHCYLNLHLGMHHCFKTLDGSSWHTYLPIPWLWNKIYKIKPLNGYINSYDFL